MIDNDQGKYFCYLTVNNQTDEIIFYVIMAISLPLALLATKNFVQLRGNHNRSTAFVYTILLLWWLSKSLLIQPFLPSASFQSLHINLTRIIVKANLIRQSIFLIR